MMDKVQRSYKHSAEADLLIAALAIRLGLSKTGVLETAVRALAKSEGVTLEEARRVVSPSKHPA